MQKEIIINSNPQETRVALLENGVLAELYIEPKGQRGITGNIYKGRVTRVLPGMQAAFVNIGLAKDAFLYVLDFFDHLEEYEAALDDEGQPPVPGPEEVRRRRQRRRRQEEDIEKVLSPGQEVLVQVAKEPIGTKGARVTSHISLPGRYLVYMPTVDHIGVSRRITDQAERQRLKEIVKGIRPPSGGFIVRTVGEGKSRENFEADMHFLTRLWSGILRRNESISAPALIHRDLDLLFRIIRDLFTDEVNRILIDSVEDYERCLEFVENLMPHLASKVRLYLKDKPIFEYFNIEPQIEKALKRKVWLKSGGYIVIDETEALVCIDVNTGKYVGKGKRNLEETIVKINLEAIKEIVRQVRLRDLGGIIIIDFIDMEKEENRRLVLEALAEELKKDRTRSNVLQLTELGLVEMTRKRVKQSLGKTLTKPCPYCKGNGRIKSDLYILSSLEQEVARVARNTNASELVLRVNPAIAELLLENKKRHLLRLEKLHKKQLTVLSDEALHQEEFSVEGV